MSTYGGHIVLIITRDRLDIPANISHMICFFRAPKIPHFLHVHHLHILKAIYFLNLYAFLRFIDTCLSIPEQIITTAFRRSFKSDTFIACVLPHHPHNFRCLWNKRGDGDMLLSCASHIGWSCVCSICSESHKCDTFFVTAAPSEL